MSSAVESESPPPPRPPVAAAASTASSNGRPTTISSFPHNSSITTEHLWAAGHPDVQRACFMARVSALHAPLQCRLLDIPAILQEGPTCGLTAVSMLCLGQPTAGELLQQARASGYTRNGEMFSAAQLMQLVHWSMAASSSSSVSTHDDDDDDDDAGMTDDANNVWLFCGDLFANEASTSSDGNDEQHSSEDDDDDDDEDHNKNPIKRALLQGGCLLVPYDAFYNHSPALRNGHRAHWALIVGYLIDEDNRFFVFARHGKTRNLALWPLSDLSRSNDNLVEFARPRGHETAEFVVPAGGLAGPMGLRQRCIVIERPACTATSGNGLRVQRVVIR